MDRPPAEPELLQAILARLDRIERLLVERLPPPPAADPKLERLLAAAIKIVDVDEDFDAVGLAELGVSAFAGAHELGRAVASILRGAKGSGEMKRLGRFLARHADAGTRVGGLRLVRIAASGDAPRYRIEQVSPL